MSSMQIQIAKIVVGALGIIVSILILYYAIKSKDVKGDYEKADDSKAVYDIKENDKQETVTLDNLTDSTVLLDDKNKDETVCL
ncbi:hypothetical protein ACJDT4_09870 [Clostridium neuense]|uniref:Uncharacterized protein n=1 Tax=Clostridium neuense TaxID=1728934 RepID=A0ABW8TEF7_9CLOT